MTGDGKAALGRPTNVNGAPLLGDSRDLFRPRTSDIPARPGVYKWRDGEGRVIYVGKAKSLRQRLTNYFQALDQLHPRTRTMVLTARSLEWTVVGTELEALTLEYTWIKEFDPRFNVVFRDDKTYPYLAVSTGETVPRVWITRSRRRRDSRYFGPYAKVWPLRHSLDTLLKTFPARTCSDGVFRRARLSGRPCLLASIGKCSAPCVGRIGPEAHRRLCERLVGVISGNLGRGYLTTLDAEMRRASETLDFERAARLRDEIAMLRTVVEQNAVVFDQDVDADVFGFASDELEASVHAFFVRAGTIRGERNWSVERVEDIDDHELMAEMISQVYSELTGESPSTPASAPATESPSSSVSPFRDVRPDVPSRRSEGGDAAIALVERRDALGVTQRADAVDERSRARATRSRHLRQERTGRDDFMSPIAPVPPRIVVPVEPARREALEDWLTGLRGAATRIAVSSRGDLKTLMDRANDNASQALQRSKLSRVNDMGARTEAMRQVAEALGLGRAPLRIECYDVSNAVDGRFQVASMVVFEDAMPRKSEYRRFEIRGSDGAGRLDDLDALYETLSRRFRHGNIAGDSGESMEADRRARASGANASEAVQQDSRPHRFAYRPNLVVVDGARPQAEAAARAMADRGVEDVAVCGLSKRLEEVWLPGEEYPVILPRQSEGLYLLQRVRDESHRFAITYHRTVRRRGALRSALDDVPGVGPALQKRLLTAFGSVRRMRNASVEQLEAVEGIGHARALSLRRALDTDSATALSAGRMAVDGETIPADSMGTTKETR
ncbi:excinuclease ABC subunit UvrC [uncultured Bifidobacterium sp.]|uniref:excinuclease ABC subunit UvrC n=1 Tax=uncultured Bifidobacterium sp. TaxID=165187 RepID=UPI0028DBAFDE|nr:excinuclease ABC subunit UvrC [uncultured Bifidobacterium sp.]